ncbi:hypothetical protein C2G38_2296027 [Gigaspora rosea]|uniref:Uncharacterized protein n=1 Tax=Gigaspora rosea TaxID=44941 RepID=A0A397VIU5_9GLOM|nr:hypothetical protein C2G38_2296027 [Gigaspora rosea]
MSKQSKQPTKRSARLLQHTDKPGLESLVHDDPQEHQLSLLPQPSVSIELSEPSQVQKDMTSSTQESNVNTNSLLSRLVGRHPNIHLLERLSRILSESFEAIKSEEFDRIKEENRQLRKKVDDLKNENKNLDKEMSVLMQINELFNKESTAFRNQIKELEMKLKIANQEKGKSRADKLFELPIEDFNISNKNEEIYHFFVDEDEESDIERNEENT